MEGIIIKPREESGQTQRRREDENQPWRKKAEISLSFPAFVYRWTITPSIALFFFKHTMLLRLCETQNGSVHGQSLSLCLSHILFFFSLLFVTTLLVPPDVGSVCWMLPPRFPHSTSIYLPDCQHQLWFSIAHQPHSFLFFLFNYSSHCLLPLLYFSLWSTVCLWHLCNHSSSFCAQFMSLHCNIDIQCTNYSCTVACCGSVFCSNHSLNHTARYMPNTGQTTGFAQSISFTYMAFKASELLSPSHNRGSPHCGARKKPIQTGYLMHAQSEMKWVPSFHQGMGRL